ARMGDVQTVETEMGGRPDQVSHGFGGQPLLMDVDGAVDQTTPQFVGFPFMHRRGQGGADPLPDEPCEERTRTAACRLLPTRVAACRRATHVLDPSRCAVIRIVVLAAP